MFIFSLLKIKHVAPPLSSLQMVLSMENSDPHHDVLIIQKQSKLSFPHFPPHSMAIFLEDPTNSGRSQAFGKGSLHTPAQERERPRADLVVLEP